MFLVLTVLSFIFGIYVVIYAYISSNVELTKMLFLYKRLNNRSFRYSVDVIPIYRNFLKIWGFFLSIIPSSIYLTAFEKDTFISILLLFSIIYLFYRKLLITLYSNDIN